MLSQPNLSIMPTPTSVPKPLLAKSDSLPSKEQTTSKTDNKLPLLAQLAQADEKHLEKVIEFCIKEDKPDFQHATSFLIDLDTSLLLKDESHQKIYKCNTASTENEVKDKNLLGINHLHFYIFKIRLLLEYLVQCKKSLSNQKQTGEELKKIIMCVKQEILILIEATRISDFIALTEEVKKPLKKKILSEEITKRINCLPQGGQYILDIFFYPTDDNIPDDDECGHGFYITFIKDKNEIIVRVDDTYNYSLMPHKNLHKIIHKNGEDWVHPQVIGKIPSSRTDMLNEYIFGATLNTEDMDQTLESVYDFKGKLLSISSRPLPEFDAVPPQPIDNCIVYNFLIGMRMRMRSHLSENQINKILADEKLLLQKTSFDSPIPFEVYKKQHRGFFQQEKIALDAKTNLLSLILDFSGTAFDARINLLNLILNSSAYFKETSRFSELQLYVLLQSLDLPNFNVLPSHSADESDESDKDESDKDDEIDLSLEKAHHHIKNLVQLNLSNLSLDNDDMIFLGKLFHFFDNLTQINLSGNNITGKSIANLFNQLFLNQGDNHLITQLVQLDLSYCHLNDNDMISLSKFLPLFNNLTRINLSGNNITAKGFVTLAPIWNKMTVVLDHNPVKLEVCSQLLKQLQIHSPDIYSRRAVAAFAFFPALSSSSSASSSSSSSSSSTFFAAASLNTAPINPTTFASNSSPQDKKATTSKKHPREESDPPSPTKKAKK